ncbi:hypothetical protein Ccrd_010173 [Cynara cardunculus var. scolymus]|uniref:Uncharacterized protein n=1 Tax=Cynara cardunculus var. scolymus TaxID=59895 RepID=A0A124SI31_CYNCS|nr:hypothetical protein Ccrd_010173 [Cynara cardunculus var. scolymus]
MEPESGSGGLVVFSSMSSIKNHQISNFCKSDGSLVSAVWFCAQAETREIKGHYLNATADAIPYGLRHDEWLQVLPRALVASFVKIDK